MYGADRVYKKIEVIGVSSKGIEAAVEAALPVQQDLRAELLVMGTHGRPRLARIPLVSVTERVLLQVMGAGLAGGPKTRTRASLQTVRSTPSPGE